MFYQRRSPQQHAYQDRGQRQRVDEQRRNGPWKHPFADCQQRLQGVREHDRQQHDDEDVEDVAQQLSADPEQDKSREQDHALIAKAGPVNAPHVC